MRKDDTNRLTEALADLIWDMGARGLDGVCCTDLSLVEFQVLRRLDRAGHLSLQDVGADACLTKSGATRLVDRLQERGFVERERSADDGRVCCVAATVAGQAALAAAREAFASRLGRALAELDETARTQLLAALPPLAVAVRRQDDGSCCGPTCC